MSQNDITRKNTPLRVTQMNAIYLDNEISKALQQLYKEVSRHLPPRLTVPLEPEVNLLVKLAILRYSILNGDSTFGQQLLCIKYKNITMADRILYVIGNCFEYMTKRIELWDPSHSINNTISNLSFILRVMDFINLSVFLRTGNKPLLIERFLGLEQIFATENVQRMYESKYLARELLWNGFIELLVYVLPLINYHKLKKTFKCYNPLRSKVQKQTLVSKPDMTLHTKCGHCKETPILPHHMGCKHVFCYVCLKGNLSADNKFECPICEHKNINVICSRVTVM